MKYEDVCKNLLRDFPNIKKKIANGEKDEKNENPYYWVILLIYYLIDQFEKKDLEIVKKGFSFIEKLLIFGDSKTKKLIEKGFLPCIHIIRLKHILKLNPSL